MHSSGKGPQIRPTAGADGRWTWQCARREGSGGENDVSHPPLLDPDGVITSSGGWQPASTKLKFWTKPSSTFSSSAS